MNDPESFARAFRNAIREARFALVIWAIALSWTVGYCTLRGYSHPPDHELVRRGLAVSRSAEDFTSVAGVPDWVMLGVVVPWGVCTLITVIYGMFVMGDDDLGTDPAEPRRAGHE